MLKKLNNQEIRTNNFELSLREVNLIKKLRQIDQSGELLLIIENGVIKRIKYSTVFYFKPQRESMTDKELADIIKTKVPFGKVTVLTRNGRAYAISTMLTYDDLSDGF